MRYVETFTMGGSPTTPGRNVPSRAEREAKAKEDSVRLEEYQKAHRLRMEEMARVLGLDIGTARACADWWCDRFYVDEKREAFRVALVEILTTGKVDGEDLMSQPDEPASARLEVDYDPNRTLCAALASAGVECRGFMSSADGILAQKRRMYIDGKAGKATVRDGYGAGLVTLVEWKVDA